MTDNVLTSLRICKIWWSNKVESSPPDHNNNIKHQTFLVIKYGYEAQGRIDLHAVQVHRGFCDHTAMLVCALPTSDRLAQIGVDYHPELSLEDVDFLLGIHNTRNPTKMASSIVAADDINNVSDHWVYKVDDNNMVTLNPDLNFEELKNIDLKTLYAIRDITNTAIYDKEMNHLG